MIIIGEKEKEKGMLAIRKHGGENLGVMKKEIFVKLISSEIEKELKKNRIN